MADEGNKWTKSLEQLLPFLEAAPTWFKVWVYVLIFLVFITAACMAVLYLRSKEERRAKGSLLYFSIEEPEDNDEIPLGNSRRWPIEGYFPMLEDQELKTRELSGTDRVEVEVVRLSDEERIPQDGKYYVSTARGTWRFDKARFPGEGGYEIIATGFLGDQNADARIKVQCVKKAKAFEHSVERGREARGVSEVVYASPDEVSLPSLKRELNRMQMEFFNLFPRDLDGAMEKVMENLDSIDRVLPVFPDDLELQNLRAYALKNYAQVLIRLQRDDEALRELGEAAKMFRSILEQEPEDEAAWNGLGSVAAVRANITGSPADFRWALQYIDKALELNPTYPAALHDREAVTQWLARLEASSGDQ